MASSLCKSWARAVSLAMTLSVLCFWLVVQVFGFQVLSAGVVVLALNLPAMIASPDGWSYAARFQGARRATWGSLVSWVTAPPWGGTPFTDPVSVLVPLP